MEKELLGIGKVASLSGLTVTALRFYDGEKVLRPAVVDPVSGYRFYRPAQVAQARLVAHLRRIGLPLDSIRTVLTTPHQARSALAEHLRRLEAGLADARREISTIHQLLDNKEITMPRFTLPAADLISALAEVRYAVSKDPELPMLGGVFLDSEPGRLRLVATDRYRLATTAIAIRHDVDLHLLLPVSAVDQLLGCVAADDFEVEVSDGRITFSGSGSTASAEIPQVDFPAYRSWLDLGQQQFTVDAVALRLALDTGSTESRIRDNDGASYEVSRLSVGEGGVRVGQSEDAAAMEIAVNREFLLEALGAGDQLTLGLDGPIAPLAIRNPGRNDSMSILMPVRLDQPA